MATMDALESRIKEAVVEEKLQSKLLEWIRLDKNSQTRGALEKLLGNYPTSAVVLERNFNSRLEFGTAGLRAPMGPGFNCMNDVTVMQTSQGLAAYLIMNYGTESCRQRGVVIGYDGRHNSLRFANATAAVFIASGFKVYLNSKTTATPLNPYCLMKKRCLAGIQITASHNPKEDNGYKVYAANGAQIIPPMDAEVASLIEENSMVSDAARALLCSETGLLTENSRLSVIDPYEEILVSYISEMTHLLSKDSATLAATDLKIVYTAMHGVGFPFVESLLEKFQYPRSNFLVVEEQKDPNPEFPTVSFPNPEEKGALDIAMAFAEKNGSPMVIANDPDADRFACAEKTDGKWHIFHGDELGIIFGHRCMELSERKGIPKSKMLFVCSAVSSRMLSKMCEVEGCNFEETMTGFKWMMNKAFDCQKTRGLNPVFCYEEALGYAVSMQVPDKDGVSAAAVWVELACELYRAGKTMASHLDDLRKKFGYFVSNNSYFLCYDKTAISDMFAEFRNGGKYMWEVGCYKVARIRDVTTGFDSAMPGQKCAFPLSPASEMVTLFFENGAVITLRTSGTEPKLKWYSELSATSPTAARAEVDEVVNACITNIMKPDKYPLKPAGVNA